MKNILKSSALSSSYNKIRTNFEHTLKDLNKRFSDEIFTVAFINLLVVAFQMVYLRLRYDYVNQVIPLWYTKDWGDYQLVGKHLLYLLPILSLIIAVVGLLFVVPLRRYYMRYGINLIGFFTIVANLFITYSLLRIIFLASVPFDPLIDPLYLELIIPGLIAFILIEVIVPRFINYAHEIDLVTNPALHKHPAMVLSEPSARGGGFIYGIAFLMLAVVFVGFPPNLLAFYLALFLLSLLGYFDDYQNTHPESKVKLLENPYIRLILMFVIVSIVSTLGTKIFTISSPFGGILMLNSGLISGIITTVWIVWFLNVLSWSNGIDGQFAGIVAIASIVIVLLALRFDIVELEYKRVAILGAISVGLSIGLAKYTWHPSKIMWGFGAISAGLVLSVLSILISSKIATSILIILIPFLDAFVTAARRILQGKSPFKGDRGHLHHILLDRGWSVRKIAVFYWVTTALFGALGYLSVDRYTYQIGMILAGLVAFTIILLNSKLTGKNKSTN